MNPIAVIVLYALMSVFDLPVLAGTAYLVAREGWSAWWFLVTIFICAGSTPRHLILAAQGVKS